MISIFLCNTVCGMLIKRFCGPSTLESFCRISRNCFRALILTLEILAPLGEVVNLKIPYVCVWKKYIYIGKNVYPIWGYYNVLKTFVELFLINLSDLMIVFYFIHIIYEKYTKKIIWNVCIIVIRQNVLDQKTLFYVCWIF